MLVKNRAISVLTLSILSIGVLSFYSYSPYGSYAKNLAVLSSFFVFQSLYKVLLEKKIEYLYLSPYILMTWLYFQSPFLLEEKTFYFTRVIKDEYINEIAFYMFLAVGLIYIGYSYFLNKRPLPLVSRTQKLNSESLKSLSLLFVYLGTFYRIGKWLLPSIFDALSSTIQIFFYAPTIAFALYVLYNMRTKSKIRLDGFNIIVITFLVVEFLLRLSTTLMAQVGVLLIGVFIVYFREKGKFPIVWTLVIFLVGVPLYQSRKFFRTELFENQDLGFSPIEYGFSMVEQVFIEDEQPTRGNANDLESYLESQQESQHNRFENLSFISHVVWQHRRGAKSFLGGETFFWLPLAPIPRVIFPSKPINEMGSTMSTEYGLRARNSRSSINFPMLVEAYINFGFNGIVILAFCFGIAYKWFVMKFGAGLGDLNLIMIINASKQFTHAEGNITLVFGALIQVYVFWWVLVRILNIDKSESVQSDRIAANNIVHSSQTI